MSYRAFGVGAVALHLVVCLLAPHGLLDIRLAGDIELYERVAGQIVDGRLPYADFYLEYPPGALLAFLLPAAAGLDHYAALFSLLMTTLSVGVVALVAWLLRRLGAGIRQAALPLAVLVFAPWAIGGFWLGRYDLWPALLSLAALALLLARRPAAGGVALAVGTWTKLYAAVLVPLATVRLWREGGRHSVARAVVSFGAATAAMLLPFAAIAFGGLGFSFWSQLRRNLQIESLPASLLLGLDKLGVYDTRWVRAPPGQVDLAGRLPDVLASATTLLQLAALALVFLAYRRGPEADVRLATAFAGAVLAFVSFGKVLSPQFLIWVVPVVCLVPGRRGALANVLVFAALLVTQVFNAHDRDPDEGLRAVDWTVYALLLRNALLIASFAIVLQALRGSAGGARGGEPARLLRLPGL